MDDSPLVAAIEKMLDERFEVLEIRMTAMERRYDTLVKMATEEEYRSNQIMKLVSSKTEEEGTGQQNETSLQGAKIEERLDKMEGMLTCMSKKIEDQECTLRNVNFRDTEESLTLLQEKIEELPELLGANDLKSLGPKISQIQSSLEKQSQEKDIASNKSSSGVSTSSIVTSEEQSSRIFTCLESLESKFDAFPDLNEAVQDIKDIAPRVRRLQNLEVKIDEFSELNESVQDIKDIAPRLRELQTLESKLDGLADLNEAAQDIKDIAPRIRQLHSNLDTLLSGESEANAMFDKLMPSVEKLQKDVDSIMKRLDEDVKAVLDEHLVKIQNTADDCYNKACDAKDYAKDSVELAEDILSKLKKHERDGSPEGPSSKRRKSHHSDSESETDRDDHDRDHDETDDKYKRSSSYHEYKSSDLSRIGHNIESIKRDNRRDMYDLMAMLDGKIYATVYTIKGMLDGFFKFNNFNYRGSNYRGRNSDHRGGHSKSHDSKDYNDDQRDESVERNRHQSHEDDRESRHAGERNKEIDLDQDLKKLDDQMFKMAEAVEEIQVKMDAWLKYSKRNLAKSDENTNDLKAKIFGTNEEMVSLKNELGKELLEIKAMLEPSHVKGASFESEDGNKSQRLDEVIQKLEENVQTKLCEFGSMIESLSMDQSKQIQALSTNVGPIGEKQDEMMTKIKSMKKAVDAYGQTGLQMVKLQKSIEVMVKEGGGGGDADMAKRIREIQPKVEEVFTKVNEIVKSESELEINQQEDGLRIQKILDIAEELKNEAGKKAQPSKEVPTLQTNTDTLQILNALNELKNFIGSKDQASVKLFSDLKGKSNEILKNQKLLVKMYTAFDELRKTLSTDSNTISQINTAIQSMKTNSGSNDSKVLTSLKSLSEMIEKHQNLTGELKTLVSSNNNKKQSSQSSKDDSTLVNKVATSVEKKISEVLAKEQVDMIEDIKTVIFESAQEVTKKIQSEISTTKGKGKGAELDKKSIDTSVKSMLDELNELENRLMASLEKNFGKILEEFSKQNGVASEILNSVEDMKQLTSSMPNAIHDIAPKIETIEKCVKDMPTDLDMLNANMEENLCTNLQKSIGEVYQEQFNEIFQRFELVDQKLGVIKKYAKHGASDRASLSALPTDQSATDVSKNISQGSLENDVIVNSLNSVISSLQNVNQTVKQLNEETAKGVVMEEQFEALADTILKPITEIQSKMVDKKEQESNLNELELKITSAHNECLNILQNFQTTQNTTSCSNLVTNKVEELVDLLRRIQSAQREILRQDDLTLEYQSELHAIFQQLVPDLEAIEKILEDRQDKTVDSRDLPKVCKDIRHTVDNLIVPKTEGCEELRGMVQLCNEFLERMLKDRGEVEDNVQEAHETEEENNEENPESPQVSLNSPPENSNPPIQQQQQSFQTEYNRFVTSATGEHESVSTTSSSRRGRKPQTPGKRSQTRTPQASTRGKRRASGTKSRRGSYSSPRSVSSASRAKKSRMELAEELVNSETETEMRDSIGEVYVHPVIEVGEENDDYDDTDSNNGAVVAETNEEEEDDRMLAEWRSSESSDGCLAKNDGDQNQQKNSFSPRVILDRVSLENTEEGKNNDSAKKKPQSGPRMRRT